MRAAERRDREPTGSDRRPARPWRTSFTLGLASLGSLVAGGAPVGAQPQGVPALVVTGFNGQPSSDYAVPRTSWGAPDLQGAWSSDDVQNVPLERPPALGTRLYQTDEEFAARVQSVEAGRAQALNTVGLVRTDVPTRAFRQTSLIVDPPEGRLPAIRPRAEARRAPRDVGTQGDGPFDWTNDFTLNERCITRGVLGSILPGPYGNGHRIVQAPGVVAISYEMIHDTRVFYTDGRPRVGDRLRLYLGDSRAYWDGDDLVVETRNLTDRTSLGTNGDGLRHSDQLVLTERFRRVADDVLQYQVTVDDPVTYDRPFTLAFPLTPLSGGRVLPYDCHEGNLAVAMTLSAERTEDRDLAEDLARGLVRERRPVQGDVLSRSSALPAVVARVNGQPIEAWELENAVRSVELQRGAPVPPVERPRVRHEQLDQLVELHLLGQEARRRNIVAAAGEIRAELAQIARQFPSEAAFLRELAGDGTSIENVERDVARRIAVGKLMDAETLSVGSIPEEELRAYFEAHPAGFTRGEAVGIRHILLAAPPGTPEREQARAHAEGLLGRLRAGADFIALARAESQDPATASRGGALGVFARGEILAGIESVAFDLAVGDPGAIAETPLGVHVVQVTERREAAPVPFAEARSEVEQLLLAERLAAGVGPVLVERLKGAASIEIYLDGSN